MGLELAQCKEEEHLVEDNLCIPVEEDTLFVESIPVGEGILLAAAVEDNHLAAAVEGAAAVVGSHLVEDILLVESYIPAVQCILDYCQSEDIKQSWMIANDDTTYLNFNACKSKK